jgi:hypothetical protein
MRVEPAARRSTWREGTAGPEIVIPARRNWALLVVMPVWLSLWILGITRAASEVASGRARGGEADFLSLWAAGAVFGASLVAYAWLWNAIGREVVGRRPGVLAIRREVAGLGRTREYALPDVRNLRVSLPPADASGWAASMRMWRGGPGLIAFDHGARTVRFGDGIDEAEATIVLAELGVREGIQRPAA